MTPRAGADDAAFTAAAASAAATTDAALGDVRPQPVRRRRSGRASSTTDAQREQDQPAETDELQRAIAEHDLLRRGTRALFEAKRVVEDAQHERDDRQLVPDVPATGDLAGPLERPQ